MDNKFNFSTANIVKLLLLSIIFFIVLYLHSTLVYILTGGLVAVYFLISGVNKPEKVFALYYAVFTPLIYTFGYLKIENLNIAILSLLTLYAIVNSLIKRNFAFKLDKNLIVLLALFSLIFIPGFINGNYKDTTLIVIRYVIYGILPIILLSLSVNKLNLNALLRFIITINTILIFAFILLFVFSSYPIFKWKVVNPISLCFVGLLNIIMISLVKPKNLFLLISIILSVAMIFIQFQRAFILGLLTFGLWMFLRTGDIKMKFKIITLSVIFIFLLTPIIIPEARMIKVQQVANFSNKGNVNNSDNETGSIALRLQMWNIAIDHTIENSFVFGSGFSKFSEITDFEYPHNILVDIFFCLGALGLIIFIFFLVLYYILLRSSGFYKHYDYKVLIGGSVAVLIVLLFSGGFTKSSFYFYICFLGFTLIYKRIVLSKNLPK